MFNQSLVRLPFELTPEFRKGGKVYHLPSGEILESVTTILARYYKKDLAGWRARVGHKEADRIAGEAATRGTALHQLCELYLTNDPTYAKNAMPTNLYQFQQIKPLLDTNVECIYGIEQQLYSHKLRAAGTADLLCRWNGKLAIVDFKTSSRRKKEEWIESYLVQATTYAIMASSLWGMDFSQIIIVMLVDHEEPLIFEKPAYLYAPLVKRIFIDERKEHALVA